MVFEATLSDVSLLRDGFSTIAELIDEATDDTGRVCAFNSDTKMSKEAFTNFLMAPSSSLP